MKQPPSWMHGVGVRVLAGTAMVLGLAVMDADAGVKIKKALSPTVANPTAQGQAAVVVSGIGRTRKGKLKVKARGLAPQKTFTVRVAGVPIGSLTTNVAGTGHARFSTSPGRADQPLGVDPRGQRLVVDDEQGEDELEGDIPDDNPEPCCCMEDDQGENEGEETDPGDCQAAGGTVPGADSCLPDPCNEEGGDIRCCLPQSEGAECEETTAADCSDKNGISLGAGSCEPNPCAPPPPPTITRCCVADDDEAGKQECEDLTSAHCTEEGGTDIGPGPCEPNPCVASPSGAFLERSPSPL